MNRRQGFIALSFLAAATFEPRAQLSARVYRVGYLGFTATSTPEDDRVWGAFVVRLRELGYTEGANLVIEQRFAEGHNERYAEFAAEMVRLKADVVVASSGNAARAVMAASHGMPIVTTFGPPDPVRAGLVASLAHPGGQLTGISDLGAALVPKQIQILKQAFPALKVVAYAGCPLCQSASGISQSDIAAIDAERAAAARSLGMMWLPLAVNDVSDFDGACAEIIRARADALIIGATPVALPLRQKWLEFAARSRLPTMMSISRSYGAMLTYGPDNSAIYRKAAEYVGRILGGAQPGDLPMEQPTIFDFVVNLRMARAMGLTVSRETLLGARDVIE